MREILTILAGLVVLVLAAALAAPPFVDWTQHRDAVEQMIQRASGLAIRTEGALAVRFLPTPRIEIETLRAGDPDGVALEASSAAVEIALTPLLHGEWRVLAASAVRADAILPAATRGPDGSWTWPRALLPGGVGPDAAIDDLSVDELVLSVRGEPGSSLAIRGLRAQAQALAGPWRAEGRVGTVPFDLSTGEAVERRAAVKLGIGEPAARASFDGQAALAPGPDGALAPGLTGALRIALAAGREGVPGPPAPIVATAQVKAAGREAVFEGISIEGGEGAGALRLGGTGRYAPDEGRLTLALDGRRIDLDALGAAFATRPAATARQPAWRPALPVPVSSTLKLDSVALGGEELTGVTARLTLAGSRLAVEDLALTAPGRTEIRANGEAELGGQLNVDGHVTLRSPDGERLAAFATSLGLGHPALAALAGQAVEFESDASLGGFASSLTNARLAIGGATLSGLVRYAGPDSAGPGRVDAQLAIQNIDLAALPPGGIELPRGLDLGLTIDARGLRYGGARGVGRVAGRITSDAASLLIERLEIVDLAGANGTLSGRLAPDGRARIEGRLTAQRAAPLIDLVARPWLGDLAGFAPAVLRDGSLDLAVAAERDGAGQPLRTRLTGTMAEGPFEAEAVTLAGRPSRVSITASTTRAGAWLGRPAAALPPSRLAIQGARDASDRLALSVTGDLGGLRIATVKPALLDAQDREMLGGEFDLAADDLSPLLALGGDGVAPGRPVPASLRLRLTRDGAAPRLAAEGRVAGAPVSAELAGAPDALTGRIRTERLSLPWLASALALNRIDPAGAGWSSARFGTRPDPALGGSVRVEAATLDLGGALAATGARFDLATIPDGFTVSGLDMAVAGGRAAGGFSLARQGGLAALSGQGRAEGLDLAALVGAPVTAGRVGGEMRFGASGESAAAIVANLAGAGTASLDGVELAAADPSGLDRAAGRALRSDDPLQASRLAALVSEEIGRAPFRTVGRISAPAILVAGALRLSPLAGESAAGAWIGAGAVDLKTMSLDLRGSLQAKSAPRGWTGPPPALTLGWAGPLGRAERLVTVGPLANGLAQSVLARELDRIETFELDAAERARLNARLDMDRARRAAAEEAARQARLEAERARLEAERARAAEDAPAPPTFLPPARSAPSGG